MEKKPDPQSRVSELIEHLQVEDDKQQLAVIISELENFGDLAHDAIPHLYKITTEWRGFNLAEIAKNAIDSIELSLKDDSKPKKPNLIRASIVKGFTSAKVSLKKIIRSIVPKQVSNVMRNLKLKIQKTGTSIKAKFHLTSFVISMVILSIVIPTFIYLLKQGDSIVFWGLWVLVFYITIWSFGHYNRTFFRKKAPFRNIKSTGVWYLNRKFFMSWFLLETILYFLVGWNGMIKNVAVLVTIFLAVFAIFGLAYGLIDISCPYCGAVNSGVKIRKETNFIDYRCRVCKRKFIRSIG